MKIFSDLASLKQYLSLSRRRQGYLLLFLMFASVLAEVATIGALVPFIHIVVDPESNLSPFLLSIFQQAKALSGLSVTALLAVLFAVVVILAGAIRLCLTWITSRFAFGVGADLGNLVFRSVLGQPYAFHVSSNSAGVLAAISKVQLVVSGYLMPALNLITSAVISIAIVISLAFVDAQVVLWGCMTFGFSYFVIAYLAKRKIRENGMVVARRNTERINVIQEGLGSVRDIIIDDSAHFFLAKFETVESHLRGVQAQNSFLSGAPRYFIETLVLMAIAFMASVSSGSAEFKNTLPVIGAFALALQKLIPLIQQIYYGWAQAAINYASLKDVLFYVELGSAGSARRERKKRQFLPFAKYQLENVKFSYNVQDAPILKDLSLTIHCGDCIGIVGRTGSGKSTLVDLVMGLLHPQSGSILVDHQRLSEGGVGAWMCNIAHVPQSIYLRDGTIEENIVFASTVTAADTDRLQRACAAADLLSFIQSLPEGLNTRVGERGAMLSGGQRQRIGIARALYKQSPILVLDEATSALDEKTEARVIAQIMEYAPDITLVMIAHRITTLRHCNRIICMDSGRISQEISYEELLTRSANVSA